MHYIDKFVTYVNGREKTKDLSKLQEKYTEENWYICKNLFRIIVDKYQGFGEKNKDALYFIPKGYDVKKFIKTNMSYRIQTLGDKYPELTKNIQKTMKLIDKENILPSDISSLL